MKLNTQGALDEGMLYVERAADGELFDALIASRICHVLAPRQMGKTSLCIHVQRRLATREVRCAVIDLSILGSQVQMEAWYFGLLQELCDALRLPLDPQTFWRQHGHLSPVHRWVRFLGKLVAASDAPIVIFIDELDVLLALPFGRDDFLASLRAVHDLRVKEPAYHKLTFCLIGVVAPAYLMADPGRTPFNIGQSIHLGDFSREEIGAFAEVLPGLAGRSDEWLDEIYAWTNGHPYMTQRLCEALVKSEWAQQSEVRAIDTQVEEYVTKLFLRRGRTEDANLSYAERRLEHAYNQARHGALLEQYEELLTRADVEEQPDNPILMELELCGLAAVHEIDGRRHLAVRNRIFAVVFDQKWIEERHLTRELAVALRKWQKSDRHETHLLRGTDLAHAQAWAAAHSHAVTPAENEFLLASLEGARRDAEQQRLAGEMRIERSRRERVEYQSRVLRHSLLGISTGLLLLSMLAAALFVQTRRKSDMARSELKERALVWSRIPGYRMAALVKAMRVVNQQAQNKKYVSRDWEALITAASQIIASDPLSGHTDVVNSVTFSPDGRRLISASWDGTVRIWSVAERRELKALRTHKSRVNFAAYSPDARKIVTCGEDGTAQLFDAATVNPHVTLTGHTGGVMNCQFSPDGQRVITASRDKTARVWNAATGELILTLRGHSSEVTTASFSPDGKYILTSSCDLGNKVIDRTSRLWDAQTGASLHTFPQAHRSGVMFAGFTARGDKVMTAGQDSTIKEWDLNSTVPVRILFGHRGMTYSIQTTRDTSLFVSAGMDATARLWAADTGRQLFTLEGHTASVRYAAFSPDEKLIATASADRTIRIYDLYRRGVMNYVGLPDVGMGLGRHSADGKHILSWTMKELPDTFMMSLRVFDTDSLALEAELPKQDNIVYDVDISPDSKRLVIGGRDRQAQVWDLTSRKRLFSLEHKDSVLVSRFTVDGQQIITTSDDSLVCLWEAATGRKIRCINEEPPSGMWSHSVNLRKEVLSSSSEGKIRLWDLTTGQGRMIQLPLFGECRYDMYADDGNLLSNWLIGSFVGERNIVLGCGKEFAIYNIEANKLISKHSFDSGSMGLLQTFGLIDSFPDGKRFATPLGASGVGIFNVADGSPYMMLEQLDDFIWRANPSSDGSRILVSSSNVVPRLIDLDFDRIFSYACRVLRTVPKIRGVTVAERAEALQGCP